MLNKDIQITVNGLPENDKEILLDSFKKQFLDRYLIMNNEKKSSDLVIGDLIKKVMRDIVKKDNSSKKPEINSHIIRL